MKNALPLTAALIALWSLSACGPKDESEEKVPAKTATWGYVDGSTVTREDHEVKNTRDKAVYLNERYDLTAYRIPVPNGKCAVKLHFAETYEGVTEPGKRVFSVSIEKQPVLVDFDPFKEAGNQRFAAVVKEFKTEVKDGELTIGFEQKTQKTMINGIEVSGKKGFELRINCAAAADYKALDGKVWKKDQAFSAK